MIVEHILHILFILMYGVAFGLCFCRFLKFYGLARTGIADQAQWIAEINIKKANRYIFIMGLLLVALTIIGVLVLVGSLRVFP
jgi:hypothetical protein